MEIYKQITGPMVLSICSSAYWRYIRYCGDINKVRWKTSAPHIILFS